MSAAGLKSVEFRREREAGWRELEDIVQRAERRGLASLSAAELMRLPNLYRAAVSSLSVARVISLDQNVVRYLENLSARAYLSVYGARTRPGAFIWSFFAYRLPAAVRAARWPILIAALVFALGGVTGFALVAQDTEHYYAIMGVDESRNPSASTADLRETLFRDDERPRDRLARFASFLFSNNAGIGMLAFALGFALGLPAFLLLFYNGLRIGAFAALFDGRGLSVELWGWLLIHGSTELLAVCIAGGAGLVLGGAIAFPGRHTRLDTLRLRGPEAGLVALGAVFMFFVAALLEGFARELITDTVTRYIIASVMLAAWLTYFTFVGRGRTDD